MNTQANFLIPGSSIYYSLLYCNQKSREFIGALHAFYEAVREIAFKCQDTKVAQIKYQWWREELERCQSQTAQHPVTKILQSHPILNFDNLNIILNFFEQDKKISLYEDEISLIIFYQNTAGLLEKTINQLLGIQDEIILNYAANIGIFIQKILHIRDLRSAILRGKIYFSGENLLSHRVNLYEFSQLKLTENIRLLLQTETQKISNLLKNKSL
jgi:phytoene synthase